MKFYLGLLLGCFYAVAVNASDARDVAAEINGEKITFEQVRANNRLEVFQAQQKLYELEYAGLKGVLIEKLIKLDPRSKGLDENQFLSQFVVVPFPISDEAVDKFIVSRRIAKEKINANLKQQVRNYMMQQNMSEQIDNWMQAQIKKHGVKVNIEAPIEPRFDVNIANAAYRGGKNAPVTIVEFSDFECPYCSKVNDTLYELDKIYGDKIKVVYKHYPLSSIHPEAQIAAEASICAQRQGMDKFWSMHNKMFENFRNLSEGRIKDFANSFGLDMAKFKQCLEKGEAKAQVQADLREGQTLGVQSTPAFFINGRFIRGALPLDEFKKVINEELGR